MQERAGVIINILKLFGVMSFLLFSSAGQAKSFLWKISDLDSTVYLFGSIHVGNETLYPLDDAVKEAFALSRILVLEINPNEISRADENYLLKVGLVPKDKSLEDYLTADEIDYVKFMAKGMGYDYEKLKRFKPWMAGLAISQKVYAMAGYKAEFGIEAYLTEKANSSRMPISALESMTIQTDMFAQLETGEGKSLLISEQSDVHSLVLQVHRLMDAWKNANEDQLDALINEGLNDPSAGKLRKIILEDRNAHMADKIVDYISLDKNVFVAVGAGHFVGKNSILEYLTQKGYKVERLNSLVTLQ